ncbi:hypothetical protein [Streptacidiphilus melanogenes]|uniref:hypothetical protein n=1 Tax=Streptacidiphilus melanogenes TaxID=411235 RepID=UPI0005AA20A8|nr:hypothetical protein [Streptacidiphilus melanogenes]
MLTVDDPDLPASDDAAARWLTHGLRAVSPAAWLWITEHGRFTPDDETCGPPEGYAVAITARMPGRPDEIVMMSGAAEPEDWIAARMSERPLNVGASVFRLDSRGAVDREKSRSLRLEAVWDTALTGVPQPCPTLLASTTLDDHSSSAPRDSTAEALLGLVKRTATVAEASFGHVCDDAGYHGLTSLDEVLWRGGRRRSVAAARSVLRGYSWATVLPRDLVDRLGGVPSLEGTGAFVDVHELRGGSVAAKATERFSSYDDEAVLRVFRACAPVLPAGMPRETIAGRADGRRRSIVWEDASRFA